MNQRRIVSLFSLFAFSLLFTGSIKAATNQGFLDSATCTDVSGWATTPTVDVFINGSLLENIPAVTYRPDVAAFLGDNGLHGFSASISLPTPVQSPTIISVRFHNPGPIQPGTKEIDLSKSPQAAGCHGPAPVEPPTQSGSLQIDGQYNLFYTFDGNVLNRASIGSIGSIGLTLQNMDNRGPHTFGLSLTVTDPTGAPVGVPVLFTSEPVLSLQPVTVSAQVPLVCGSRQGAYKATFTLLTVDGVAPVVTLSSVPLASNVYFMTFNVDGRASLCP